MIITRARASDLPLLLQYRHEAAAWLRAKGVDQWNNPFPPEHILASIEAGTVYLIRDGTETAATVTLDSEPEPDLWSPEELEEPSLHLHKLIVLRPYAGRELGSRILDWAGDRAARTGVTWLRINVFTGNTRLQRYYLDRGFEYVRTAAGGGVGGAGVACWLAQRSTRLNNTHGFTEDLDRTPSSGVA